MSPESYLRPEITDDQLASALTAYTAWKFAHQAVKDNYTLQRHLAEREAYSHLLTFPQHVTAEAMRLANS